VSAQELDEKMKAIAPQQPQQPQPEVHVRPNKASQYAVFANVLSASKRLGVKRIAVIGAEQFVQ
jgi:biopolymer transport protein ExbD